MSDWQPIETAPKDGTRVFLHRNDREPTTGCWRVDDGFSGNDNPLWLMDDYDDFSMGYASTPIINATHWMPLPKAPKSTEGEGKMSYLEGVRIDYETADLITRLALIEALEGINNDIAGLKKQPSLKDYEKENLEINLKYHEALLVVIGYYSTSTQMDELLQPSSESNQMNNIIELLDKAEIGNPELDGLVFKLTTDASHERWTTFNHVWHLQDLEDSVAYEPPPPYTTSIDAAMTLVPDGWEWSVCYDADLPQSRFECYLRHEATSTKLGTHISTPALAICIAAMKAMESDEESDE